MTTHELKCWNEYFNMIWSGHKTFEIRYNDRNYQIGDELVLKEYFSSIMKYSGRQIKCVVTYILDDNTLLKEGYIAMAIKMIERSKGK